MYISVSKISHSVPVIGGVHCRRGGPAQDRGEDDGQAGEDGDHVATSVLPGRCRTTALPASVINPNSSTNPCAFSARRDAG
jgi:hypothetical protein